MKSTCFHTRLLNKNTVKVCGGTFQRDSLDDAAERICKGAMGFFIRAIDSQRATFVDSAGREVRLYLSVDPAESEEGKRVLAEYRKEKAKRDEVYAQQEEIAQQKRDALIDLAESIGLDAALTKLRSS